MAKKIIPQQATNIPHLRTAINSIVSRLPDVSYTSRANREIDFYGASDCIAKQLKLEKPLYGQATWKHGWLWFDTISPIRLVESGNKKISNLVFTKKDELYLKNHGYTKAVAVGAPFIYAHAGNVERISNSILVFPPHSTASDSFDARNDRQPYVDYLKNLKNKFHLVVASIGGADVLNGNWQKALESAGIPWITGAWSFDRNALTRMQILLRSFEFITSNNPGSHFPYAAYCGCKASFWGKDSERQPEDLVSHPFYKRNPDIAEVIRKIDFTSEFKRRYPFFFVEPQYASKHEEWAKDILGEENKKPANKIAELFGWNIKKVRDDMWSPVNALDYMTNDELIKKAILEVNAHNYDQAFMLTNVLKRREVKLPNIDLVRGKYFLHKKNKYHALEALKEELRFFPNNDAAKKLMDQMGGDTRPVYMAKTENEREFISFLNRVRPFTRLNIKRAHSLYKLAKQICLEDIPGNFVECGVAAGGSTMLLAMIIRQHSKRHRKIYACDTFSGMPIPGDFDTSNGIPADDTGWGAGTCASPEEVIRNQCEDFGLGHIVETRKGLFEDTLPALRDEIGEIAMLHMDADWYSSTMAILNNLFDQLNNKAMIQIDDYGAWDGCRKAVDEYQLKTGLSFDLHRIDQTGMWCRKPLATKQQIGNHTSIKSITKESSEFINPELSMDFMDLYLLRSSILQALNTFLPQCTGTLLDIGCGEMPYKKYILHNSSVDKYIGLDFAVGKYTDFKKPDLVWDGNKMPLDNSSIDCAIATELFEHVPSLDKLLLEVKRVLKPDGTLFFTVPFLWPLHDIPGDEYRYTPYSLKRLLTTAGYENIDIKALGGWDASLAQMIGLWVKRKPMSKQLRTEYKKNLFPFYRQLIESDEPPESFDKNQMITGLYGTASKKVISTSNALNFNKKISPNTNNVINSEESSLDITYNPRKLSFDTSSPARQPKVAVIQGSFPALTATFILDQLTGLLDRGFNVTNWATYNPKATTVHPSVTDYNLIEKTKYLSFPKLPKDTNPKQWLALFEQQNDLGDIQSFDAFHIHYGSIFNQLTPLFQCYPEKLVIVSFHGYDASYYFQKNGDNCYTYLFERANQITTPSHTMKNVLVSKGCPAEKIFVHRYGVNLKNFKPCTLVDRQKPLTLLTVARLVEKKGIKYFLQALSIVSLPPQLRYRIIGAGPLEAELHQLVKQLGLQNNVQFLGAVNKTRVVQEMAQADIFILTSVAASDGDQEGVPVSLIEAHAMGLPVISSYHAGIPELVIDGKTGFLSPEKDVASISMNLSKLIENPQLRKLFSSNACKRVEKEFNIQLLNNTLDKYIRTGISKDSKVLTPSHSKEPLNPLSSIINVNELSLCLSKIGWQHKQSIYAPVFDSVNYLKTVESPDISIVVISWRLHPDTIKNFESLSHQRDHNFELIFVDNGRKPGEFDILKPSIDTYIKLTKNTGACLARNIGSVYAKAPILLFLEDNGIPSQTFVKYHKEAHDKYDVISVRGAYKPRSDNCLNKKQNHYNLGEKPFPTFANIEGNVSYDARTFYSLGGWDDNIKYGHGGIDLSYRILKLDPDMRKQIYSPLPIILHDYATDENHFCSKIEKQQVAREDLERKHNFNFDEFFAKWRKLSGKSNLLIKKDSIILNNNKSNSLQNQQPKKDHFTDDIIMLDPASIIYWTCDEFNILEHSDSILDGNWDKKQRPFEENYFYKSYKQRLLHGIPWEETEYYIQNITQINKGLPKWGCRTAFEFLQRCEGLDMIYKDMKQNGFQQAPDKDYITVNIGRKGELFFNNGRHRLTFAKLLGLKEIPVKVTVRHKQWASFKQQIMHYADEHKGKIYAPLSHPDLRAIPCNHTGRFEIIRKNLNTEHKTVLDIGSHWGYMCHRMEEEGKQCTAIEQHDKTFYFLNHLKQVENKDFIAVNNDVFTYVRQNNRFDTVLALAIFHHFLKTEKDFEQLKWLLGNLDMKEMFFQAHHPQEGQMKNAYCNFTPEEFALFIVDNSCLDEFKEIGDFNGRKLYHIYRKHEIPISCTPGQEFTQAANE